MKLSDFHYDLPEGRIAQEPIANRDQSQLLVVSRATGMIRHHKFSDLERWLKPTDVLVLNATRVFPARLRGKKKTGGKVELLLLESRDAVRWRALVRGSVKAADLIFPDDFQATMETRLEEGEWVVRFAKPNVREYLEQHGEMPLPPYIKRPDPRAADLDRYQTVFATSEGAVAAPTAGFHFTRPLLDRLSAKGIKILEIVLHVGWGTFRPVRVETVENHRMLPESYQVGDMTAQALTDAALQRHRIIAVGTTVVRTLETICDENRVFRSGRGESSLYIYPGYRFKAVDALITNFHLPDSTPLLLANAFYSNGRTDPPFGLRAAYQEAIQQGYRFYSYGDAMFIQ